MENTSPNRKDVINALKTLRAKKRYEQLIEGSKRAIKAFPEDAKFEKFLHFGQAHYVHQKLNSDIVKELGKKQDYETLLKVYLKLLSVFPTSGMLKKLLKGIKNKINKAHLEERERYFQEAEKHLKELIASNNLEDALQACYQMISYDLENKTFTNLLKKIQKKREKQIDKDLIEYFDDIIPKLKADYKANKKAFIRV